LTFIDTQASVPKGTGRETTMIHMHADAFLIGRHDLAEERNRMHLVALNEARIATEYRESVAQSARAAGPTRRSAMAGAGTGSTVDLAACCA
jgi:hypothetical protein